MQNADLFTNCPRKDQKSTWQFATFYDTPCLQGQWLSSNVGPRFICEDEGDGKVVDMEGGGGLGYESKWWMWMWVWR